MLRSIPFAKLPHKLAANAAWIRKTACLICLLRAADDRDRCKFFLSFADRLEKRGPFRTVCSAVSGILDIAAGMDRAVVTALFSAGADVDAVKEEIGMARDMGVTGVPCFIIDNKYAVMGAQSVDVLTNAFREIAAMKAQERVGKN